MPVEHRLAASVILTQAGGRRYATDTRKGEVYELNETAWLVLQALAGPPPRSAASSLAQAYPDVPRAEVEADVRDLVAQLETRGLVVRSDASSAEPGGGAHARDQGGQLPV